MVGILNYGLGNIRAFANIYKSLNIKYKFISKLDDFNSVSKIILPGVGAFDYAMSKLNNSGLRDKLEKKVLVEKVPVIGICVGMQMLANRSEEGKLEGLGWIEGTVRRFEDTKDLPLPHMGWNKIEVIKESTLLKELDESYFYFLHSYYFDTDKDKVLAKANYISEFDCIINKDNIYGIQCHPEKSHHFGIELLKNFGEIEC